jgi:putative CocE/NonD family hydrolase
MNKKDAPEIDQSRRVFMGTVVGTAAATTLAMGAGLPASSAAAEGLSAQACPAPSTARDKNGIRVATGLPSGAVSQAQYRLREQLDVLTPMRDGVRLAMDVIRPDAEGPFPVVLIRTPYDKVAMRTRSQIQDLVRRGYLVAIQDCRGRFNSDGEFDPYRQEFDDGFDTVEWLEKQHWCDGNVGMIGGSYVGQTQWFAAAGAPKALKAIVPTVSPPGNPFINEPFYGGSMILAIAEWMVGMGRRCFQLPEGLDDFLAKHRDYFESLPLSTLGHNAGTDISWWQEGWLKHPKLDEYWQARSYQPFWSAMKVPALNVTGWWDMNFIGAPHNFSGMSQHAATREAREGQRLVIGPWPHWVNGARALSGVDFGADAVVNLNGYTLRFLDRWLRGKTDNALEDDARAHVFVVGANQWWEADQWPLPGTCPSPMYLHSGGQANSHRGDGVLTFDKPGIEPHDSYESDPNDPVTMPWSLHDGPVDDRPASARQDVLCYTSEVLTQPIDVVGEVKGVLYASSSARDCDWHVRLVDVHPDGTARFMCHGVLRARFRKGFDRPALLTPNEVTRFDIDMTATGVRFLPNHRIRIEIASSWFPRFDRNPQTGSENWMTDNKPPVLARQVIKHDSTYPSHIVLPIITGGPE